MLEHDYDHHVELPPTDTLLWRYMDIAKFEWLIRGSSLYFARADRLGDPFEGSLPRRSRDQRRWVLNDREDEQRESWRRGAVKHVWLNCWHANPNQSAAMWRLYAGRGVAITTTFGQLQTALDQSDSWVNLAGQVKYWDFSVDAPDEYWGFGPFFWKRKSYQHELEVRALIHELPSDGVMPSDPRTDISKTVQVSLGTFLNAIYLAPGATKDLLGDVEFLVKASGLSTPIMHSELDDPIVY